MYLGSEEKQVSTCCLLVGGLQGVGVLGLHQTEQTGRHNPDYSSFVGQEVLKQFQVGA